MYITEELQTPIEPATEVIVCGAGSAGVGAALAAARQGARVTLVDPAGYVGGNMVSGLYLIGCYDGEKQIVKGLFDEIVSRLRERGGVDLYPTETTGLPVDPEMLKVLLLEMLEEAGVELRLHTRLANVVREGPRISYAVVEGKDGRRALPADYFIDTTGDADLAFRAGVPCEIGRTKDGAVQPQTLIFSVGGIDLTAFEAAGGWNYMYQCFDRVTSEQALRNPRKKSFSGYWTTQSRQGELMFNVTRVLGQDVTKSQGLTAAEVESRLQAWEFVREFLRPHVKGFADAYLVWTAAHVGVRETRRILGHYVMTKDDIWNFRKFEDTVVCGSYPIDIHSPTGADTEFPKDHFYGGKYWTIPYRSLVALEVENLLMAGRCLSATHEALSAVRCIANTLAMGEAVGVAAALCHHRQLAAMELPYEELQASLLEAGAWLGESVLSVT